MLEVFAGRSAKLSRTERAVLDAVIQAVDINSRTKLIEQLKRTNKIQRLPGGVEVNFYRMEKGKPTFDSAIALENTELERCIGTVIFEVEGRAQLLEANVWAVRGFLSAIEYRGDPSYIEEMLGTDLGSKIKISFLLREERSAS